MRKLKLFFSMLMLIAFSVGNVWAVDYDLVYTLDGTVAGGNSNYAQDGGGLTQSDIDWSVTGNTTTNPWRIGGKNLSGVDRLAYSKTAIADNIAKIEIEHGTINLTVNSMKIEVASDAEFANIISTLTPTCTANTTATVTHPDGDDSWENAYYRITYNVTAGSSNTYVQLKSVKFYKEKSASDPDLSAAPIEIDFGTVEIGATVANQTVAVSFANLTGSVTYSELSDPFSASGTISATGDEITIFADATNAGTFQQTLTIESTADSKSVEVTVKMKVAAPTGTFELFSGDIEEGDYVLVSTNALSNSVNNSRIASQAVTISEDKIVNPDAAIIWHIAPVGETSYWTLYNEAVSKYAGGTTSKNQGALLADVTDYAKWTITEGTNVYEFVNLGRETGSSDTGNKYLRYNSGNAENSRWACYGSGTGKAPALYKKADGKQNADLSYATAQYLIKKNASFTAQELTNPHSIEGISYASDNTAVAEVNASTGAVTIKADATGAAKITASFAGDASYRNGSASYTIFVAEQAGTAEDPLTEASAKALIDLGCTLNAHVNGIVLSQNSTNFTVTLTDGFQFYKAKDLTNVPFESAYLSVGDEVTAVGALKKFSSTYELDEGCYLTFYEQASTSLTTIANDEASAYTVAQALEFAANPTTYDLSDVVYVRGKVAIASTALFSNKYLTYSISDDGTTTSVLKVYNGLGIDGAAFTSKDDILVGDVVVVKGNLTQFNTELEFAANNELVSKKPVATIAIDNMELEYAEVATISATITPAAAASTVEYSIKAGGDDVITLSGDQITAKSVTGTATIVATIAGTDDYEGATKEFTVSVAEADTRKVANSPATFTTTNGNLDPADIAYASYQGGSSTAPAIYNDGIRLYQKGGTSDFGGFITLTAKAGCTIDEVQITTTSKYATTVAYSKDDNENLLGEESVAKSGAYTTGTGLNVSSVNILNLGTGSDGRLEIASIKVYYTGEALIIDHYELGGTYQTAFMQDEEFNHTGLIVYAAYDALGENKVDITASCTFSDPDMSTTGEKTIEITYNDEVVKSYTINVNADSRKVANSPATFTTVSGDMTPNDITFASNQGGASTAPANYNDGIRLYQAPSADAIGGFITLKAKKGCTIDQVKITTTNTYATTVAYSVDGNVNLLGSESVAKSSDYSTPSGLNVESVNIVNKGTGSSGRLEIASIKVWYTGDALAVDHYILGGTYATEFEQYGEFNYEGLTVTAAYNAGETITEAVTGFTVEADLSTAGNKKANVMLNSVKIAEYDITVNASAKTDPALAYIPASVVLTLGDALSAPTFSNTHNVSPITYSSDKPAVATVDAEGNIALAGGCGTAAITASFAGDDDYIDSEATFTITVNEPAEDLSGTWVLATSVAAGDKIIIGATYQDATKSMGAQNGNNRLAVASTLDAGVLSPGEGTKVFTLVDAGDGKFAIQALNGNYLSAAGTGTSNYLKEAADYTADNAKWSISIDGEGVASVVALSENRNAMQYNSGSTLFSCYASVTSQRPINIYKKDVPVKDLIRGGLGNGKWGTLCPAQNVENVEGAVFYLLSYLEEKDGMPYNVVFDEILGSNLEAGKPYFFIANAKEIRGNKTGAVLDAAGAGVNGFYGYIGDEPLPLNDWHKNYEPTADKNTFVIHDNKVVRINQAGTKLPSEKCYININDSEPSRTAVEKTYGRRRISMSVQSEQTATDVDNVQGDNVQCTKVLRNGQFFIIRGEKMYDATGRLVK